MKELDFILSILPNGINTIFKNMDKNILDRINEIRIRRNNYIIIVIKNTSYFVDASGTIFDCPNYTSVICDNEMFDKAFMQLCDYSIYSNMNNLINGFITLKNGARVGVSSTAVYSKKDISSVKDVTSLNIRVPRAIQGCGKSILDFLYIKSFPSIIIAGAPNSGKTTLLRDIARSLSSGFNNQYKKIVFIDERNEFAGKCNQDICVDIGVNSDVITAFSKSKGIEIATRTLSPEMIVCDEISTLDELNTIKYSFSAGVKFAVSVHVGSKRDLYNKKILLELINTNEFEYIVWLDKYTYKPEIIDRMDFMDESNWRYNNYSINNSNGIK